MKILTKFKVKKTLRILLISFLSVIGIVFVSNASYGTMQAFFQVKDDYSLNDSKKPYSELGIEELLSESGDNQNDTENDRPSEYGPETGIGESIRSEPSQSLVATNAPIVVESSSLARISIPSIGVNARIVELGLTQEGAVDAPNNVYDVGWYNGSSRFGESGAVFLDGHSPGVFSNLAQVGVGNFITITTNSGETYSYTVVAIETTPLSQVNMYRATSTYGQTSDQGLNIMTCSGRYVHELGTYDHRTTLYSIRSN